MRLRIDKIVYPGRSLGLDSGKVVFTDRGLPGEIVEAELVRDRKTYAEARTQAIVEASPDRVEPRCGHFLACSPYQDMAYELQLAVKKAQLEEIFGRELKRPLEGLDIVPSPEVWGYRSRIRLAVHWTGDRASYHYHEPGEAESFVAVDRCFLVGDRANEILGAAREIIHRGGWRSVSDVEIRTVRSGGLSMIVFHLDGDAELTDIEDALGGWGGRFPGAGAVALVKTGRGIREVGLAGRPFLEERVGGVAYRMGARSFFQVNLGILEAVLTDVGAAVAPLGETVIADLYSGIGTFGLQLAAGAREVFAVESEPANIGWLRKNRELNKAGNLVICEGTSEEWLPEILERRPGAVVVDPPRRGLEPSMLRELVERPVRRLVYLSCNPSTLARDLKPLLGAYGLERLKAYDFFPHTPHIETLAVLVS